MIFLRKYIAFTFETTGKKFAALCPDFQSVVRIADTREAALDQLEESIAPFVHPDVPAQHEAYIPPAPGIRVHLITAEVEDR